MLNPEPAEYASLILQAMRLGASEAFSEDFVRSMNVYAFADLAARHLVTEVRARIYTEDVQTETEVCRVRWPATWWQHFKESCFPRWLRRRFPVHWHEEVHCADVTKFAAYPKLPLVFPDCGPAAIHYRVERRKP